MQIEYRLTDIRLNSKFVICVIDIASLLQNIIYVLSLKRTAVQGCYKECRHGLYTIKLPF
jgi:hypothetical protein